MLTANFFCAASIKRSKQYEIDVLAWCSDDQPLPLDPRFRGGAITFAASGYALCWVSTPCASTAQRGGGTGTHMARAGFTRALGGRHLQMALRYVELNPVRANLVDDAEQYRWSSARSHLGLAPLHWGVVQAPGLCAPHEWAAWLRGWGVEGRGRRTARVYLFGTRVPAPASQARPAPEKEGRSLISVPNLHFPVLGSIIRLRPSFLRHNGSSWWKQLSGPAAGWS